MSTTDEQQRHRVMIERECQRLGLGHSGWEHDPEDDRDQALLGRWVVTEDDEDLGLYEGEEGKLVATVVGAQEHNNEKVAFYFTPEDCDGPTPGGVTPFEQVEPV